MKDNDETDHEATHTVERVIKLSKTSGTRGTETTATFKGFANESATVFLNDRYRDDDEVAPDASSKLAEVIISDNTGTLEIDTTPSKFKANLDNVITAQDASGNPQNVSATFNISPKVVLDPEETSVSKSVTVKLSDWPNDEEITLVEIGASKIMGAALDQNADNAGVQLPNTGNDGKVDFSVMVPTDANRGTQTVKVTGTDPDPDDDDVSAPSATASLSVGVLSLTVQPATVVPGQQITIQGSGFKADDEIKLVTVGGLPVEVDAEASSAGNIVVTINVPSPEDTDGIGDGTKTVKVATTDAGSNRVAEGSIEISEPTITLSPTESRRGTTVNVDGSGFPSGDLVQVKYENNDDFVTVAAGSADASGAVSIDFVVPSYANIGSEHDVQAVSVGVYAGVTAEATHETPGAAVTLSSNSIASGETITVSGVNFPAFATVKTMEIGGVDVRPVPAPATSIDGDFESSVLVPQLELGNQTVSIEVSSTTITTFLQIVSVAAPSAPADVFGSLGDRLTRVWQFDNATQAWSFYDPRPEFADFNSLTEVSSGQIVTVILSEGDSVDFASTPGTLYAGTNQIVLD